jgi:hypothetical protein
LKSQQKKLRIYLQGRRIRQARNPEEAGAMVSAFDAEVGGNMFIRNVG